METPDVFKLKQNLLGMFIIGPKLWLSSPLLPCHAMGVAGSGGCIFCF